MRIWYDRGYYQGDESIRVVISSMGSRAREDKAFMQCKNLRRAVLPNDLRTIGESAFQYCENLEDVSLGNRLEQIGDKAFFACSSLREIVLPDTLQSLGKGAFGCCIGLREVIVPEGVLSIGNECFSHCLGLRRVSLPASVKEIGEGAFAFCGDHIDLQVHPDNPWFSAKDGNLLSKDGKTLQNCPSSSSSVTIPDYITELGKGALSHNAISQVNLPKELQRIGVRAFFFCFDLHTIDLPEGLLNIDPEAFRYSGITELTIPKSVRFVGKDVLANCEAFRHLTILGSKTKMMRVCSAGELQPDAMLTADHLEIEDYPEPFTAVHGLRSVVARWMAGEKMPEEVVERFRAYLAGHCLAYLEDPQVFSLMMAWKAIPSEKIETALRRAVDLNDPAVTAALLQYQHENFPKKQRNNWENRK